MDRDKFLTEKMGLQWHDHCCSKDFSTPEGFFALWNWAKEQGELWERFILKHFINYGAKWGDEEQSDSKIFTLDLIDPDRFANAVYEFLREEHGQD